MKMINYNIITENGELYESATVALNSMRSHQPIIAKCAFDDGKEIPLTLSSLEFLSIHEHISHDE